jgi:hypothetical protein
MTTGGTSAMVAAPIEGRLFAALPVVPVVVVR